MDSTDSQIPITPSTNGGYFKNIIIIILCLIVILLVLGINIFTIFTDFIKQFIGDTKPVAETSLPYAEYSSNESNMDIFNNSLKSISSIFQSNDTTNKNIDNVINDSPIVTKTIPTPNETTNNINTPTSAISKWCLIGEFNGTRGCISVTDQDKCLSGQVFPQKQMCLNMNSTANITPTKSV